MPQPNRIVRIALALTGVIALASVAHLWRTDIPGVRLAFFPPGITSVQALRQIVIGGGKPISSALLSNVWLVHFDADQPADLPGAMLTDAGPLVRLASAACLTPNQTGKP